MTDIVRSKLLPPYLEDSQAWTDLADAIDAVFGPKIDTPTQQLSRLRDTWILTAETEAKVANDSSIIASTDFESTERNILIRQANMLGFNFADSDLLTDSDYQRIVRSIAKYWYGKGTPDLANFLGFVLDSVMTISPLWSTTAAVDYGKYGAFKSEAEVLTSEKIWNGGTWYPTTHVEVSFDPF